MEFNFKGIGNLLKKEPSQGIGGFIQFFNNTISWNGQNAKEYIDQGYDKNSTVYAIVRLIAKKCATVPLVLYEVKDQKAFKKYQQKAGDPQDTAVKQARLNILRSKALEEVEDHKIMELLKHPNKIQSYADFVELALSFKLVTGNSYIWGNILKTGDNKGLPQELHVLPAQNVQIIARGLWEIIKYQFIGGTAWEIPPEQIMHLKYPNLDWDIPGSNLVGMSPLRAALMAVTRSNSATTASVSQLQNMGPPGVLFSDTEVEEAALTEVQASQLKQKLYSEYSGIYNRGKFVVSGQKLGWLQMGIDAVDLDIIAQEKWTMRDLCSVYGISSQLLNDPDNKTYNNMKEAALTLITNAVMPEMNGFAESFNRSFIENYNKINGKKYYLAPDYSVFMELQEDLEKLGRILLGAYWITPNEKRVAMNWDEDKDQPLLDEYLVPQGLQMIGDLALQPDAELPDENLDDFKGNE